MEDMTFPKKSAAPKPAKKPKYRHTEKNLADDKELVEKVRSLASYHQNKFEEQAERRDFIEKAKIADRMARCSRVRDTADRQYQDTQSNVGSTMVIRRLNVLTAIENDLYFPQNGDVPVAYSHYEGSHEYTSEEGREIAEAQNLLLQYTFEKDDMQRKIEDSVFFLNKYGQQIYALEWDYRREERTVREVAERYEDDLNVETGETVAKGRPKSWRYATREFDVANNPCLRTPDIDNVFFNALIDDMQKQMCIAERSEDTLSYAYSMQRSGHYMNVGDLAEQQLYSGRDEVSMLDDRKANADEGDTDGDPTGLLQKWDVWIRVPINKEGKWDPENEVPTWHWATFYGQLENQNAVCVRLIRNPYHHRKNPYKLVHSHRDDKGAFHMWLATMIESLYEEHCTAINQYFDNKTLQNKTPFLVQKGNVLSTDMTADKNKIIHVKNLDSIRELPIKDTTQTTAACIDRIENDMDKALGTENSVLGQAFGSRTSASEAQTANANAMKPLLDKARYQGNQLFPWLAEMIMELWRQYSDPDVTITVLHGTMPKEVKPAQLWGSLKTKLTAIDKFEDDITRRAEQNNFLQVAAPILAPIIGNKGMAILFREIMKDRKIIDNVDEVFPANKTFDAERVARSENQSIYFNGVYDMPAQGEDHETHLPIHKAYRELISALPPDQINKQTLAILDQHIVMTEQMMSQEGQTGQLTPAVQQQQPQVPGAGEQPTLNGEVSGDTIAGLQGGL